MRAVLVFAAVAAPAGASRACSHAALRRRPGAADVRGTGDRPARRLGRDSRARHRQRRRSSIASASRSTARPPPRRARSCRSSSIASPYSGGTQPYPRHDITGALYVPGLTKPVAPPPPAAASRAPEQRPYNGAEPPIRDDQARAATRATSCRAGSSSPTPTRSAPATPPAARRSARPDENLAIKAAIDWFNGKGKGFDRVRRRGAGVLDDGRDRR